ncbi:hypothetical protein PR048_022356 [Dryococelus australis]|uniref:Uncharacterized protein n=1 Tax=Dryococelus australis TaxID=614101 RepID=A0ABQ9H0X2_9NEOP|nr:hypothetical protein PR048_022356 [Dryococelus australis]
MSVFREEGGWRWTIFVSPDTHLHVCVALFTRSARKFPDDSRRKPCLSYGHLFTEQETRWRRLKPQAPSQILSQNALLLSHLYPVKKYRSSSKWSELRRRLRKVLDHSGKAHQQLCGVSKHHGEPLKEVCAGGGLDLLSLLLNAGLPTEHVVGESGGDTLLHAAAASGNLHSLNLLLGCGADIASRNSVGETPLLKAVREGHVALAKSLLARGADPGACDAEKRTSLHWAAAKGHLDLVKLLVDAGADVKARDGKELTPLDSATSQGHDAVADFLISLHR